MVRWDRLFDDLEARFEAEEQLAADGELADLTRAELAGVTLLARLEAQVGAQLGWWIGPATSGSGNGPVTGLASGSATGSASGEESRFDAVLLELGSDWVLLRQGRRELLVPLRAVTGITGLARAATADVSPVLRKLSMGSVLRRLARDRVEVSVRLAGAASAVTGTIDRVAGDHLDLAEHAAGEFRRPAAVLAIRTVPWAAVVWVSVAA